MIKLKKLLYLGLFLVVFYYIFIANILVTGAIIVSLYVVFKLFKLNQRRKLGKIAGSKELFRESELGLFIALVAKVAKADGRVQEREAQLIGMMFDDISKIFPNQEQAKAILKEIFNEEKEKDDDTKEIAQALNSLLGRSRLKRKQYIEFLIQLAIVDDGISSAEDKVLREIVTALNISSEEYRNIQFKFENMMKNKQESMTPDEAYAVLGVSASDDLASIKKSYRKLVRQYHPDIIKSQDKDESYIEEATVKTQEINQAYAIVKELKK